MWTDPRPSRGAPPSASPSARRRTCLVDETVAGLERRIVPTLHALPDRVPLVVLADRGFRENRSWGRGPGSRYGHGGLSLEESVVPVATFGIAGEPGPAAIDR